MSGIAQVLACGQSPSITVAYVLPSKSITSGTSFTSTLAQTLFVGDRLLVIVAADNGGTNGASAFSSQSLSSGTASISLEGSRGLALNDPGAASAGVDLICSLFKCTAPGSGANFSTFFTVSTTSKAAALFVLRGIPYTTTAAITGFVSTNGVAATSATSPTLSTEPGDLVVGVGAVEARTGITADTSAEWTINPGAIVANTGTAGTSMILVAQCYKETAASTRDYTLTANAARDMIAAIFSIRVT